MNLGVLQACVRAWRTHCLPFLPDFAEICYYRVKCKFMAMHVSIACIIKHITYNFTQIRLPAAEICTVTSPKESRKPCSHHLDWKGARPTGYVGFLPTTKLSKTNWSRRHASLPLTHPLIHAQHCLHRN
jgi:hypothetical protein